MGAEVSLEPTDVNRPDTNGWDTGTRTPILSRACRRIAHSGGWGGVAALPGATTCGGGRRARTTAAHAAPRPTSGLPPRVACRCGSLRASVPGRWVECQGAGKRPGRAHGGHSAPATSLVVSGGAMAGFPENLLLLWSLRFRCLNWRHRAKLPFSG